MCVVQLHDLGLGADIHSGSYDVAFSISPWWLLARLSLLEPLYAHKALCRVEKCSSRKILRAPTLLIRSSYSSGGSFHGRTISTSVKALAEE